MQYAPGYYGYYQPYYPTDPSNPYSQMMYQHMYPEYAYYSQASAAQDYYMGQDYANMTPQQLRDYEAAYAAERDEEGEGQVPLSLGDMIACMH